MHGFAQALIGLGWGVQLGDEGFIGFRRDAERGLIEQGILGGGAGGVQYEIGADFAAQFGRAVDQAPGLGLDAEIQGVPFDGWRCPRAGFTDRGAKTGRGRGRRVFRGRVRRGRSGCW